MTWDCLRPSCLFELIVQNARAAKASLSKSSIHKFIDNCCKQFVLAEPFHNEFKMTNKPKLS